MKKKHLIDFTYYKSLLVKNNFRYTTLAIILACVELYSSKVQAKMYTFDATQLDGGSSNIDISPFEQDTQLPGIYQVDVLLNGEQIDSRKIFFSIKKNADGKPFLRACLTRKQLKRYGIKVDDYPRLWIVKNDREIAKDEQCANLLAIPQAHETFQFNKQQLVLSIPQIALQPRFNSLAPQELWNDGISAFLLNYQINAYRSEYKGNGSFAVNNLNMELEPGINLGAWRFRNQMMWHKQEKKKGKWMPSYTYIERGLYRLKSRLVLGEHFTTSDLFDRVAFRGCMVGSDENMVPYNQWQFAPMIQGVAQTLAHIEVKQNGYVIYTTTVAPGRYKLSDVPVGGGGDLQVTVFEADGSRHIFIVPYTLPAIAIRQGYLKYNLMGGQYRSVNNVERSPVGQATFMYGLPWDLTAYLGMEWANHYQAEGVGLGAALGNLGSLSLDEIQSKGQKRRRDVEQGKLMRIRYNKSFGATQTGFTVVGYQYLSPNYNTLSEVLDTYRHNDGDYHQNGTTTEYGNTLYWSKPKKRISLTLNQSLGKWGAINLSGSRENHWNHAQYEDEISASYSGPTIKGIQWSVDLSQRKYVYHRYSRGTAAEFKNDNSVNLWVSISLDNWLGGHSYVSYQMQNKGGSEISLNGHNFDHQLYWNVRKSMESGIKTGKQGRSNLNLHWDGTYGTVSGSYGYNNISRQMSTGLQGGVIIHSDGITFGHSLGNTVALVKAPGANGVSVGGGAGIKTDFRGYTTLSYLSPYRQNKITLDPSTLPPDTEILQTDTSVVPTAGAVVPANFKTLVGGRALIKLTGIDERPIPFGAVATIAGKKDVTGIVGDEGNVYMTGLENCGRIFVRWGNKMQHCQVNYKLPKTKDASGVYIFKGQCR